MATTCEVLIVGAGPTGLMLAVWLARAGVRAIVVDGKPGPTPESRALGVQARTMETYDMLGLTDKAREQGTIATGAAIWVHGHRVARAVLAEMGGDTSPHPYMFIMGQDRTERMLLDELLACGGEVWWQTTLTAIHDEPNGVAATLSRGDGSEVAVTARYACGCDGARSAVRKALGVEFAGGTYGHRFYVADVTAEGALAHGELGICVADTGFQAFFPMPGEGRFRIVSMVPDAIRDRPDVGFADVQAAIARDTPMKVTACHWFSTYHVHHRVASHFRVGRIFLVGDAAHVHSPVGGQGMNTGLMDATNLGWKLAAVLKGAADERILDSYEQERIPFARKLVHTTDRIFTLMADPWPIFQPLRGVLPPAMLALASWIPPLRHELFGLVSQTRIEYRASSISRGAAGGVRGGDRLPWVRAAQGSNYDALTGLRSHLQVYGAVSPQLQAFAAAHPEIPLVQREHNQEAIARGIPAGAVLFVRPDGYVAYAAHSFDPADFLAYLSTAWGASPADLARVGFARDPSRAAALAASRVGYEG